MSRPSLRWRGAAAYAAYACAVLASMTALQAAVLTNYDCTGRSPGCVAAACNSPSRIYPNWSCEEVIPIPYWFCQQVYGATCTQVARNCGQINEYRGIACNGVPPTCAGGIFMMTKFFQDPNGC